jgi:hypothetical protein
MDEVFIVPVNAWLHFDLDEICYWVLLNHIQQFDDFSRYELLYNGSLT